MSSAVFRLLSIGVALMLGWMTKLVIHSMLRASYGFGDGRGSRFVSWGDIPEFSLASGICVALLVVGIAEWRLRPLAVRGDPRSSTGERLVVSAAVGLVAGATAFAAVLFGPILASPEWGVVWPWLGLPLGGLAGIAVAISGAWMTYRRLNRHGTAQETERPANDLRNL
jgi:hypothetical protein